MRRICEACGSEIDNDYNYCRECEEIVEPVEEDDEALLKLIERDTPKKSIYDEVLFNLRINNSMRVAGHHVLTREQYSNVLTALAQAQKQEKLLVLYKELAMFLTTAVEDDEDTHAYTFANINSLKEQILELEK